MKKKQKQLLATKVKNSLFSLVTALLLFGFYYLTENVNTVQAPESLHPPVLCANQVEHDLEQTISQAILEAKKSVLLAVYTLTDSKVIQAINQKSQEGIAVKVITDGAESPFVERKLCPKVKVVKRFGKGLMHLKILVVDSEQVWIGSANMTTESLCKHGNLVTGFSGKDLAVMIEKRISNLDEEGSTLPLESKEFHFQNQKVELWFLPDHNHKAIDTLKKLISKAKKTIRIAMFTWTRMDLAQAVVDAAKRGVKVETVIDGTSGKGCSAKIVSFLEKNPLYVGLSNTNALLHHKFMIIDNKILVNGSANWTKRAFTENDDCFLIIYDLTPQQIKLIQKLWKVIKSEAK